MSNTDLMNGRTLFRTGITLVVLAAALFFRYSIEQGWVGPVARVALAGAAGATMIGIGVAVTSRRPAYGALLQGGGAAVLFLTAYAAHNSYALTTTTEAFVQLVAVAILTVGLALRGRSELLAGLGLTAAAAAPTLIAGQMTSPVADIGYIWLVGGVSTWLFLRQGWTRMHLAAGLAIAVAVGLDLLPLSDTPEPMVALGLQSALTVTWAMLVAVPLAGTVLGIGDRTARLSLPIVTSSVGSLALYAGTRQLFVDATPALLWPALALTLAAAHLLAGRAVAKSADSSPVGTAQLFPAIALTIVSMVEGLSGDFVLVGLALLSVGLVFAGQRGGHPRLADAGHLVFVATTLMGIATVAIVMGETRTIVQLIPGASILAAATVIGSIVRHTDGDDLGGLYLGAAYVGSLLWMAAEFPRLGAEGLSFVTAGWAVIGLSTIVIGRLGANRTVLGAGFATIGLALAKLFFIDLAEASPLTRISLFAGIGVLLLGAGYWLGDDEHGTTEL